MRPCSLYTITHRETGRSYVGISVCPKKRWLRHWWDARQGCDTYIGHALRAYGREAFDWKIEAEFIDAESAKEAEKAAIAAGFGHFNLSPGGDWNPGPCAEARLRMSLASKGKPKSPETVARMSAAQMGHTVTEEGRKNLSASHMGNKHAPETIEKIRAGNVGKHAYLQDPAVRAKAAANMKGRTSPNKGKPMSDAQRELLRVVNTGRKQTPEHRKNTSIAATAAWARRKAAQAMVPPTQPQEL